MSNELAAKLLERNRVGALLRVFATTPEAVEYQTESALDAVEKLLAIKIDDRPVFARIDLLVSSDRDYVDSDCGLSGERLRTEVSSRFPDAPVHVLEIKKGDIYCVLLNYGIANQLEDRISYSMIISHGATEYISKENVFGLLGQMQNRARVAGLALRELERFVVKGRVSNVFSIWHNKSLVSVGGFDLRAAQKKKGLHMSETVSVPSEGKNIEYPAVGGEEIIPLIRLVKYFGPSIGIVLPCDGAKWKELDETIDPVAHRRHFAKLATKEKRQEHVAKSIGESLEIIEQGILQ